MATNYAKVAYDKFALIIKTAYTQYKRQGGIIIRDVLLPSEMGHEETILLTPIDDILLTERSGGRSDEYTLMLRYYRTMNILDYDKLTQVAEDIMALTIDDSNQHISGFWHYIGVDTLDYTVDAPLDREGEPMSNVYGFTMNIKIRLDKYA